MKAFDRWLQTFRFRKASRWIPLGSNVLDVGTSDGALFVHLPDRAVTGIGIDPVLVGESPRPGVELRLGGFPAAVAHDQAFDAVLMLAVVEHVQPEELRRWAKAVPVLLKPGGRLIVTTPSPKVDHILHLLIRLRVIDGIGAHEHYGFEPKWVPEIFSSDDLVLVHRKRFQFGLNNLFVFERT
jgi:SAM-dependent methyltransferase